MKNKWIFPVILVLLAAICGILRGRELYYGFESASGLAISNSGVIILTRTAVIISAAALLLLSIRMKPAAVSFKERFTERSGGAVMIAGAVALMCAAPVDYFLTAARGNGVAVSRGILMLFSALSGACCLLSLIRYKKAESERLRGFFSLVPVFMFCYALVMLYRDIAPEPSAETFVYEIFGVSAFAFALYYVGAHAFGAIRPKAALFCSALAFLLLAAVVIGVLFGAFVYGLKPRDAGMLGYYTAGAIWSFGAVMSLCARSSVDDIIGRRILHR